MFQLYRPLSATYIEGQRYKVIQGQRYNVPPCSNIRVTSVLESKISISFVQRSNLRYIICVLLVSLSPKFQSVSLYCHLFWSCRPFDTSALNDARMTKTTMSKVPHMCSTKLNPESQISLSFALRRAIFKTPTCVSQFPFPVSRNAKFQR